MTQFLVKTPEPKHTGAVGNVHFVEGAATVDGDKYAAEVTYFRAAGYRVDELNEHGVIVVRDEHGDVLGHVGEDGSPVDEKGEPFDGATPAAPEVGDDDGDPLTPPPANASAKVWREHVVALGGEPGELNRDQLRELSAQLRASKEGPTQ